MTLAECPQPQAFLGSEVTIFSLAVRDQINY